VIAILKQRGVKAHFLLMGFPEQKYRQLAESHGVADIISFTGKVNYSEAPRYLAAADIALSPKISLTEANGKLFNYMACGLPSLVFDTPVNREILGDAAVYATYGNAAEYADRLETLLADLKSCRSLGDKARKMALDNHSWNQRGQRLVSIYSELLK
jgi:glycosyltransferase involved in cell wall biosynthesis